MLLSKKFLQLKEKIEVLETFIKQEKQELEKKLTEKFEALEALKNEEVDRARVAMQRTLQHQQFSI